MNLRRMGALLLGLVLTLSLTPALAVEDTVDGAAQEAIGYAAEYGGAVSVQYALWEDGAITSSGHTGAYSLTENRVLTDDILYGIGSVSKVYTAAAVLQLVDADKVELDLPVTTYLPDFKMADERYQDISVRMLLNHSSGLMGSTMNNGFLLDDSDTVAADRLLEELATQSLKDDPGAFSVYCNDGFTLAQLLVERVSGLPFGEYLHQNMLAPSGLENTYIPGDDFDSDRLAKTYASGRTEALPPEAVGVVGTGGIYATASDLAAFGGLFCGTDLLTQTSVNATLAPAYLNGIWPEDTEDQLSYGLGWDAVKYYPFAYSGIQAAVKGGDTLVYHAGLIVLPEQNMAVAVLSSGGLSTYNEMAGSKILTAALAQRGIAVDETIRTLPKAQSAAMPPELTAYSGVYGNSTSTVPITVTSDGKLTVADSTVYRYHSDGSFRNEEAGDMLQFVEEENGQIYLWQKAYGMLPGLGQAPASAYIRMYLPDNPVPEAVQQAWDARNGRLYLQLNQKYTSETCALAMPIAGVGSDRPGYMVFDRLVDEQYAEGVARIPGTGGRDWQNVSLSTVDGLEYLSLSGGRYVESTVAKPLYGGLGAYTTIPAGGDARWYQVGELAGKTMTVELPEHGAFYVYDQNGLPVAGSLAWGDTATVLPEGGWLLFMGDPGVRFRLTLGA